MSDEPQSSDTEPRPDTVEEAVLRIDVDGAPVSFGLDDEHVTGTIGVLENEPATVVVDGHEVTIELAGVITNP